MSDVDPVQVDPSRPRVWGPALARLDLLVAGRDPRAMVREAGGWWRAPSPLAPGTDYLLAPEGRGAYPDPRSFEQPRGVEGPTRVWDPRGVAWEPSPDRDPLGGVFYELHVGTFTPAGTLWSAAKRLSALRDLGVDTVELMPLAAFSGHFGWGYDGVSLYAVHPDYGGPRALAHFVNAAHRLGLLVCVDTVLNHLGPWGNSIFRFAPYYSERHQTPWGQGLDLDGEHAPAVRAYLLGVCRHWLVDMHADALRLDAVHAIQDDSPTHLLQELAERTAHWRAETGRRLTLVAESDRNQPRTVLPVAAGGMGMDAQWADDVHHALHVAFTGETQGYYADFADPDALPHVMRRVFYHDGRYSTFRGARWGAPVPDDLDRRRFVVFSQNHDQVGNRAEGDRPSARLDDAQLAGLAALVVLSPFSPLLFQGEEWASRTPFAYFADQETEERARAVREGRAREFAQHGWAQVYGAPPRVPDPTARRTVERSTLAWAEASSPRGGRMRRWYADLIRLRRAHPDARIGRPARARRDRDTFVLENAGLVVAVNFADAPRRVDVPASARIALAWGEGARVTRAGQRAHVSLEGHGVAALEV